MSAHHLNTLHLPSHDYAWHPEQWRLRTGQRMTRAEVDDLAYALAYAEAETLDGREPSDDMHYRG